MDGFLWGAQTTLRNLNNASTASYTLRLPLADAGNLSVQVFALPEGNITCDMYPSGLPVPSGSPALLAQSNAVVVPSVQPFAPPPKANSSTLVGMEWEPWFTPANFKVA